MLVWVYIKVCTTFFLPTWWKSDVTGLALLFFPLGCKISTIWILNYTVGNARYKI